MSENPNSADAKRINNSIRIRKKNTNNNCNSANPCNRGRTNAPIHYGVLAKRLFRNERRARRFSLRAHRSINRNDKTLIFLKTFWIVGGEIQGTNFFKNILDSWW